LKSYLINLDRSPERLQFFTGQAARSGFAFERIAAVDGRQMSDAERARVVSPQYEFQPLNPGEIAVFMSHRVAWQRLLDSGEARAAVFEDDVVLSARSGVLLQALGQADWTADLVKLETTDRRVVLQAPTVHLDGHAVLRPLCSWHGGAAGYVIRREAAARLLQATWPLADPVDQVLFNPMSRISASLRLLQLCPALCIQKDILDKGQAGGAFATTIDRHQTRGRLIRHGVWIDLKRAWTKHRERARRGRLARMPGHTLETVAFDTPAA
jgi:glycosyl transferase, family 25